MRVAMLTPNYYPADSGNAITVRRIERHLRLLGCEVEVFPLEQLAGEKLVAAIRHYSPQVLHAFHGYLGGRVAYVLSALLSLPYLVTLTGTDVNEALCDQRSHDTHKALRGASRLVAFHHCIKRRLGEHLPSLEERTVIISQGVEVPLDEPVNKTGSGDFTFFLPAGMRKVKNVLFPLRPLGILHAAHPQVRLLLVGPIIDAVYAGEVMEALEPFPFARYAGKVPHEAMAALYREADVVLNTSHSEGGMANTLLEAMAHARPVLAADIEGNRSLIKDGVTGLLYHDSEEFQAKAELLMNDHHLRLKLARNGRCLVHEKHSPEKEASAYLDLYQQVLSQSPSP